MSNQNDTIKSFIVKIECNGMFLQSGVLWIPNRASQFAYVFTVAHGIIENAPSNIRFWRGNVESYLPINQVLFHLDKKIDAAILIVPKGGLPVSPYSFLALHDLKYLVNHESPSLKLQTLGYPALRCSGNYPGPDQQHHFPCEVENFHVNTSSQTFMAFYDKEARISESDPDVELKGFSGGGLFASLGDKVFLCGIYPGAPMEAVHYRDFTVLSLQAIKEICISNNLPIPYFQPLIPNSLRKHLSICQRDLGSKHILNDCLQKVSGCDFAELIKTSCGQCNPCEYGKHFYLCDRFQQQLLISRALLIYHNAQFDEHEACKLLKDEDCYEVRIICSDVRPTCVFELIRVLKQDYLGQNKLSENTLILWTSKERCKQSSSSCTRAEYHNIISDIANAYPSSSDISEVNEAPEQLAVMNILYILDEMETNTNAFSAFLDRM